MISVSTPSNGECMTLYRTLAEVRHSGNSDFEAFPSAKGIILRYTGKP